MWFYVRSLACLSHHTQPQLSMTTTPCSDSHHRAHPLIKAISQDAFTDWYRTHRVKQNLRDGQPWRHTPASLTPPDKHPPHRLLQCHRKTYYATQNAPKEDRQPTGIFWSGTRIEEDLIMPFLEDIAATAVDPSAFVQNSMWVDYHLDTAAGSLQVRGATDPVLCTREGDPLVPTEVKSKQSLDSIDEDNPSPAPHHRAQLHAYLYGLNQTVSYPIQTGVLIYIDRQQLDLRALTVQFDQQFWKETLCQWASTQSTYRLEKTLPPAEPEHDWECGYCSYRERCGQGDHPYKDQPVHGFLPLVTYPRQQVEAALEAEGDTDQLTPTLAHQFPDLTTSHSVADWHCPACSATIDWDDVDWQGDPNDPPVCPRCANNDWLATLRGPPPTAHH